MINIHPALLPAFKGLDTHARALEAGVKIHGATVHFVVPEMDSGPIIAQGAVAVHDDDTRGDAGRARAWRSSTASIRWRSGWWPRAASSWRTAAAASWARTHPTVPSLCLTMTINTGPAAHNAAP